MATSTVDPARPEPSIPPSRPTEADGNQVSAWQSAVASARTEHQAPRAGPVGEKRAVDPSSMSVQEIRDAYGIPDLAGDGILDIKVDGDKTVATKATEDFVQTLRDDLKNGKIAKDSDEAKLLDLIDAQGAIDNGYELYGYAEAIQSGSTTYRESQSDPTKLTGTDVKDLLDEEKVAGAISDLMGKKGISDRYDSALKSALDGVPSDTLDSIKNKTLEGLFSDGKSNAKFEDYIIALKEKATGSGDDGLADKIDKEVGNYFSALKYFDPEKYAARKQEFDQNMMTHQLDGYVADPETVDPENLDAGLRQTVDIWQSGINGVLGAADKGSKAYKEAEAINMYFSDFKGMTDKLGTEDMARMNLALRTVWQELQPVGGAPTTDLQWGRLREVTDQVISDRLGGLSEDARSSFRKFVDGGARTGTFGALTGAMSFVSGGLQLANGGWSDMSGNEKIAAVRDLIGGLSSANDFAKFGSNLVNMGTKSDATAWLGLLDDNFPDIWGSSSHVDSDIAKKVNEAVKTASDKLAADDVGLSLGNLSEADRKDFDDAISKLGEQLGASPDGSMAKKLGRTFVRFMGGAGLDVTGGVMDIVTGVRALKNADTALEKAGAGLSIGGGSATTAMAAMNTIKMFAPNGSNLAARLGGNIGARVVQGLAMGSRVLGPVLGIAGTVFGVAGALIAEAINHQKMQKLTDSQGEFFQRLAGQGVTAGDWGDKLEYARYASYMYGGRDTPEDQSLFAFQKDEWEHFRSTEGERGSSLNRLAPYLHRDGNLREKNLFEKYLSGATSQPGPHGYSYQTDDARPFGDTDMDAGGYDSVNDYFRINVARTYDAEFYKANQAKMETIIERWDEWNGKDSIVSEKDLKKIVADTGKSEEEKAAAQFLLDNNDFRHALDAIREGGSSDSKISSKDLNAWLAQVAPDRTV
ncbi:hypothetical protein ACFW16_15160 [Inquilinus sp. NPDC058860]|uniref:hypothetical protein n=1 Tax=Inquilinus sp. NPDC058860 TaxID=3346652 RepID=UPI00369BFB90